MRKRRAPRNGAVFIDALIIRLMVLALIWVCNCYGFQRSSTADALFTSVLEASRPILFSQHNTVSNTTVPIRFPLGSKMLSAEVIPVSSFIQQKYGFTFGFSTLSTNCRTLCCSALLSLILRCCLSVQQLLRLTRFWFKFHPMYQAFSDMILSHYSLCYQTGLY